jgi:GMP synthase (glutamine-hydrolysing)
VRATAGKQCVKKSEIPEIGWADIQVSENPIFEGITAPVCMVSHYDEVCNLTENFKIIASTPGCPVHGFQYKNLPVWGVQFHPEYNIEEANEIFELISKEDPLSSNYYYNALADEIQLNQNEQIIVNFLSLSTD